MHIIIHGMQLKIQAILIGVEYIVKLLPTVLLIPERSLETSIPKQDIVVPCHLIMADLLIRHLMTIRCKITLRSESFAGRTITQNNRFQELSCQAVSVPFHDSGCQVIITERKMRITPPIADSQ